MLLNNRGANYLHKLTSRESREIRAPMTCRLGCSLWRALRVRGFRDWLVQASYVAGRAILEIHNDVAESRAAQTKEQPASQPTNPPTLSAVYMYVY